MGAEFLRDETIPDGTHVQPGTRLTKRWILLNTGEQPWDANTKVNSDCHVQHNVSHALCLVNQLPISATHAAEIVMPDVGPYIVYIF